MKALALALALMGLGACAAGEPETLGGPVGVAGDDVAPAPVTPNPATADEDSCGMAAFASLIGEPAAEIDRNALPPRSRVITPEMMVTQDYAPRRLNIHVSSEGRVSSLRCG